MVNQETLSIIVNEGEEELRQEIRENPQVELERLLEALIAMRNCDEKTRKGLFYDVNSQALNKSIYSAIKQIKEENLLPKEHIEKYTAIADRAFAIIKQKKQRDYDEAGVSA